MKEKIRKNILKVIILLLAVAFLVKFHRAAILRMYIETCVGNCEKMPILCKVPEEEIINPKINEEYFAQLTPYKFPELEIHIPKTFSIVKEKIYRTYYKRKKRKENEAIIYLLHESPNFFINLFPQLNKQGIKNDHEFLMRVMSAKLKDINNLTDALFVIIKSIFTPDLGNQKYIKMVKFTSANEAGFINYNLLPSGNYFDCNVITTRGDFFKIYIKDKRATLDLDKVLTIISTARSIE